MQVKRVVNVIMTSESQSRSTANGMVCDAKALTTTTQQLTAAAANCPIALNILTCGAEAKVALAASMPMRLGGLCSGARSDAFSMVARTSSLHSLKMFGRTRCLKWCCHASCGAMLLSKYPCRHL